ncbi:exocyst complex component sec8 [Mycena floridula]|nr:exocyst complex component sec8 [Mycena floridula]
MSRTPFPDRRRPSISTTTNGNSSILSPPGSAATRPLQINRPPSRPTTPSNSSSPRPSRPERSELRSRTSEYSDRTSGYNRDSISTTFSDASTTNSRPARNGIPTNPGSPANVRPRPHRLRSVPPDNEQGQGSTPNSTATPTSLSSALSAFQSAGSRRYADSDDYEYQQERAQAAETERLRQQRIQNRVPGRQVNGKARAGDIDAVLDQIRDGWEFVIDPDFNTVDLALQLLDESSQGKDIGSFRRTKDMLSRALKGSVDKHYQAFQGSLPHHSALLNHLGVIQTQINESRAALQESKDTLGSRRADLVQLWSRGQTLEEMMRLLDQIEHLKSVPDLLETLMSEKRLLQASVLLVRSLKLINKPDMMEIGAVSDLRSYLVSQESALRDILVDELHSHLYLKSFWCESRWASYSPNQQTLTKVVFEDEPELKTPILPQSSPSSPSFRPTRLSRFIHDLAMRPNDPPHDLNDPSGRNQSLLSQSTVTLHSHPSHQSRGEVMNPESDSFAYLETVLESLAVLGRLGSALDNVAQRVSSELYALVETTLDEVSERAEYARGGPFYALNNPRQTEGMYIFSAADATSFNPAVAVSNAELLAGSRLRLAALDASMKHVDHEVIRDFFWTFYSKMDAVAQGLRVIYEVANRIGSRRDFKDASGTKPGALFSLDDVWMTIQAEIRTLIYDYLTSEEQGTVSGRNPLSSINEILRDGRFSRDKSDKSKAVFRFADTDAKLTTKILKPHEDELTRILKDTMPGLVQGSVDAAQATLSSVGTDLDRVGGGQHHRLLIKPDAFHVSVLFQPTLAFLDSVSMVMPSGLESVRASGTVLDEFVLKVYLPQLEEKVSMLFLGAVSGPDAFLPDPLSNRLSPQPLVKSSTQLMALINSLRVMLQTTPFRRESYSRLILGVIIQYYQRCSDRLQDLVTPPASEGEDPQIALAAQWAQRSELNPCLSELLGTSDIAIQQQMCRQETNLELGFLGQNNTVSKSNLVPSTRNLASLASLYHSVAWFAGELAALKPRPEDLPPTPATQTSLEPVSAFTATPFLPMIPPSIVEEELTLPFSKEMTLRYQALIKTYEQLADLILVTIRIDMRCRSMYYLDSSMRHGNYSIEREASEPDPHIIDLNTELSQAEEFFSSSLSPPAKDFIFVGLGNLMEHILISSARHLRLPTVFGIKKISRNILALQQSIKTITDERSNSEFELAKKYYALFFKTPQEMLDGIREHQTFSFDEYQTMLTLQCGVDQSRVGEDSGTSKATDRNYSMYVIDLHGLEIENSASET